MVQKSSKISYKAQQSCQKLDAFFTSENVDTTLLVDHIPEEKKKILNEALKEVIIKE